MPNWKKDLQIVAVGVASAVALELLSGVADAEGDGDHGRRRMVGRVLLAGGVAAAYAHLVPAQHWGLRSGLKFAQLPMVLSVHSQLGATPPLRVAAWGGLTGALLRLLA